MARGKIYIYGVIGDEYTSQMLMETLQEFENQGIKDILVLINSPGGNVFDGIAIFNALKPLNVNIEISGQASSIASVIAMSGKEIAINDNSFMFIHNPWSFAIGDSDYMQKVKDMLDELKAVIIKAYADKTKKDPADIEKMMKAETFMNANQAISEGFADRKIILGATQNAMNYIGYYNSIQPKKQHGGKIMNQLWEKIKALFGWGDDIDEDKGLSELKNLKVKAEALPPDPPESQDKDDEVTNRIKALEDKLSAAEKADKDTRVENLVSAAINDGKIKPAEKDVYLNSAKLDFEGTKAKLDALKKNSAMPGNLQKPSGDLNPEKPQSLKEILNSGTAYLKSFNRQPQPKETK